MHKHGEYTRTRQLRSQLCGLASMLLLVEFNVENISTISSMIENKNKKPIVQAYLSISKMKLTFIVNFVPSLKPIILSE